MIFDITSLDKVQLVRALILYARTGEQPNFGKITHKLLSYKEELTNSISDEDLKKLILNPLRHSTIYEKGNCLNLLDYYAGKPIKLDVRITKSGKILVDSFEYDYRSGRYRFFNVLLDFFQPEEILIINKTYNSDNSRLIFKYENVDQKYIINARKIITKNLSRDIENKIWKINIHDFNYVSQMEQMFQSTINENIRTTTDNIPENDIVDAAAASGTIFLKFMYDTNHPDPARIIYFPADHYILGQIRATYPNFEDSVVNKLTILDQDHYVVDIGLLNLPQSSLRNGDKILLFDIEKPGEAIIQTVQDYNANNDKVFTCRTQKFNVDFSNFFLVLKIDNGF